MVCIRPCFTGFSENSVKFKVFQLSKEMMLAEDLMSEPFLKFAVLSIDTIIDLNFKVVKSFRPGRSTTETPALVARLFCCLI